MTERDTATVLQELRRIGVDLAELSAPLVATGLRASELADWLRTIPDGAGIDELSRRLDEKADAVTPRVQVKWTRSSPNPRDPRGRWWPTQALLDAGTDLLLEEWDPFGIRLAGTDREAIAMFAFHFFGPLIAPNGLIDPITHTTEMIASAERDHLALKPSPERHRRYLAVRLLEVLDEHPVPEPKRRAPSGVMFVAVDGDAGPPPLDPEGVCVRCHAFGTVARLTTMSSPPRSARYCEACWKEVRAEQNSRMKLPTTAAEHIARLDRMGEPPTSGFSRSWSDTVEFVEQVATAMIADDHEAGPDREVRLSEIARELVKLDDKMAGPMPPEVEGFVKRYAPPPQ